MLKNMQKISEVMQKKMTIFIFADILIALGVGYFFPFVSDILKPFLPVAMFVMLYPTMIGVAIRELKQAGKRKKPLLIANVINFIVSPLVAFLWASMVFQGFDPNFVAGWILKLTVPPAGMILVWTSLSKGDVESALLIQVIGYLIAIAAVPLWMFSLQEISWILTYCLLLSMCFLL